MPQMVIARERFEGCLLGLALGDAMLAPYEGGWLERLLWRCIGTTRAGEMRWTDDTQMALDLAQSLVERGEVDGEDLAQRFARSYRWSRGYGPAAGRMLRRIARGQPWQQANRSVYREGSFGNGGAMRAPMIGLFYAVRPQELGKAAAAQAQVTHAHPEGIEGAVLIATATAAALQAAAPKAVSAAIDACQLSAPFAERWQIARGWLAAGREATPREVKAQLGNGMAAVQSCITAIYLAARWQAAPFADLRAFLVELGGDADTLGAMAAAIWGARNGVASLPSDGLARLEQREQLLAVARALHARCA